MEFKYRAIDEQASTCMPPSSTFSYFTEQALRVGYFGSDFGRTYELFRNGSDMREAIIQRELEKGRIREEIIAAEVARRQMIEAEVRREMLLMELEAHGQMMALRMKGEGFSSPSTMTFEQRLSILPPSEGRWLKERMELSLEERLGYSAARPEAARLHTWPFRRSADPFKHSVEPKILEIYSPPAVREGKEKNTLLAKHNADLSGAKRKAVTPLVVGSNDLHSSVPPMKKVREEWSCALCQVSVTSERGLNEHLQGKKHKAREAGLRAQGNGKNFSIGLFPRKTSEPGKSTEITANTNSQQGGNFEGKLLVDKNAKASFQKVPDSESKIVSPLFKMNLVVDDSKKENGEATERVQRTREHKKKRFRFWCEMCQVGANSVTVMENHKVGKKHVSRLKEFNENVETVLTSQITEDCQKVNDGEDTAERGKNDLLENVDRHVDGSEAQDLQGKEVDGDVSN